MSSRINLSSCANARHCLGFSLLEIILVALILSVISALSLPQFSSMFASIGLKSRVEELAYLMRYAQSRAAVQGQSVRLEFSQDYQEYWLSQQTDNDDQEQKFEALTNRYGRLRRLPENIWLKNTDKLYVEFHPDGRIDAVELDICALNTKKQKEIGASDKCFTISTRLKRGSVDILSPESLSP